jgi:peptidoglycan/xylan/chitin deacetylase (PgdA/CDA1 family)
MKYSFRIHCKNDLVKAFIGQSASLFPGQQTPIGDLIVLNYHGTQKQYLKNFEEQIKYLQDHYKIIDPVEFAAYFKNNLELSDKPFLLFNFDDGIKNNLYASELLEKYKIRAFFFVVPEFINTKIGSQSKFFRKNIRQNINQYVDRKPEDLTAMSWHELKWLAKSGHEIGSHTASHIFTVSNATTESRQYEIVESQRMIADAIGLDQKQIRSFCGPKDSLLSIGKLEMELIRQHYNFCFSTFAGSNFVSRNPYFIKRVNVETFWLLGSVKFALSNLNRVRWKGKVKTFEQMLEESEMQK